MTLRRILVVALVAAVAAAAVLAFADRGSDLDLEAIAACETAQVAPAPGLAAGPDLALAAEPVVDVADAIAVAPWPGGGLAVGSRQGQVVLLDDAGSTTPLVDVSERTDVKGEGGLLDLAVDPSGRHLYVHHTTDDGNSHLLSFPIDGDGVDVDGERELLEEDHPGFVHIGGALVFGPDDLLHVGFGDGSLQVADARQSARGDVLDAKVLRIRPTPDGEEPYEIPDDNPFVDDGDTADEVWLRGVRNPWRFAFDPETGDLWLPDVGNDCYEEINLLEDGEAGLDLGWPEVEGVHALLGDDPGGVTFPALVYPHEDRCAVIGAAVYRGSVIPDLDGALVYTDFCDGELRWIRRSGDGVEGGLLGVVQPGVQAIDLDEDGEVLLLTAGDGVLRLVPA